MNHNLAILAHPKVAFFELGCAAELFCLERPEFENWYQAQIISFDDSPISLTPGVSLSVNKVSTLKSFHTLVIPSWPVDQSLVPLQMRTAILDFVERGGRVLSFCSGSFLLGYLGLLDGRMATTHWRYQALFEDNFPGCEYQSNVLYVVDKNMGCSAGSAAALDLGLAVIREDYGSSVANQVARRLVLSGHRKGGQSQFIEAPVSLRPSRLTAATEWALSHLAHTISVNDMASQASMSRRNFDRAFRQQMGTSAQEWLVAQRIVLARRIIEESQHSTIEEIASQSGFSSAGNLRHHFRKQLGVSPRQYRDNFCH